MGYRHYFYKIKINEIEKIKDVSADDFDFNVYLPEAFGQEEVFEFGKLYYDDTADKIYSTGVPLFSDKKVMEMLDDYIPYVVGKAGLLKAIEIYKNKITDYLEDCGKDSYDEFSGSQLKSEDKIKSDLKDRLMYWKMNRAIDVSEDNKYSVTNSWLYEYSIFNLVHLLKIIDWEKETLLFYGH